MKYPLKSKKTHGFRAALAVVLFLFLRLTVCAEGVATATSWPMFHGSQDLSGIAVGELPDELDLLWTFETEKPIRSSGVIEYGKVFIGSDDGFMYALNLDDGEKAWSFEVDDPDSDLPWPIEPTPLVINNTVYFGAEDGWFYALDAVTGDLKWKFETLAKIVGAANWMRLDDGKLAILFGSHDYSLYCLDAETGEKIWQYESENFVNGCPAVSDGLTAFGGCDEILHVINLSDGTLQKQIPAGGYVMGSISMKDGHAYYGHYNNQVVSIDITNDKTEWTFEERQFEYVSTPALTDELAIIGGRDRQLHFLNRTDGTQVGRFAARGRIDSSPVVIGDKVVVGSDDGRLYLVGIEDQKEIWSYEIGDTITSSPAVIDGMVVIGSQDGNVYAFGEKKN